ncbi:hypothetical protein ACF0H5_003085 [Mactra antiquata]
MESRKYSDHAYASAVYHKVITGNVINPEKQANPLDNTIEVNLKKSKDDDTVSMTDINKNGQDLNGIVKSSDNMNSEVEKKEVVNKETSEVEQANEDSQAACTKLDQSDHETQNSTKPVGTESKIDNQVKDSDTDVNNDKVNEKSEDVPNVQNSDDSQAVDDEELDNGPEQPTGLIDESGTNEAMDTTENIEESGTDDADDVVEMESQIKTDNGNGIVISLTRKRGNKRKIGTSPDDSTPKVRKMLNVSTRRSPRISAVNGNSSVDSESTDGDLPSKDVGSGISTEDLKEDEKKDEALRSSSEERRTRGVKLNFTDNIYLMSDLGNDDTKCKTPLGKKRLYFKGKKASPSQSMPLTDEEINKYKAPFEQGWKRELVFRGTDTKCATKTQADTYYFPPGKSPKLRSMVQISDWLSSHDTNLTTDNFTFMRRAIGIEGELVRNASQSRGRATVEAACRKRFQKQQVKEEHVHDDNDGQYDNPEVVIERDSDDYIGQIMSIVNDEVKGKKERSKTPVEQKIAPKVETSIENSTPVSNQKKMMTKSTARKSTTQRTFKSVNRTVSQSGVENLCSINCPGLQGIPPMLHCNLCMCLFHQECVNYFGLIDSFVCLRCKDMHARNTPGTANDSSQLQASNPTMLKHLSVSSSNGTKTVYRTFPHGISVLENDKVSSTSSNTYLIDNSIVRTSTPTSNVPLYKALPFNSVAPSPPVCSPMTFPVLLTPSSTFSSSSSSTPTPVFPVSIAAAVATPICSTDSIMKSPAIDTVKTSQSNIMGLQPLIKQEPVDDSYGDHKVEKTVRASSEALDNLKNVLSTRIGSASAGAEKGNTNMNSGKDKDTGMNKLSVVNKQSITPKSVNNVLPNFGNLFNQPRQLHPMPPNFTQPRMNFGNVVPPPMQLGINSQFRLVPVGPPIAIGSGMQVPFPLIQSPTLVPPTTAPSQQPSTLSTNVKPSSTSASEQRKICAKSSTIVVSSTDDSAASGPLIVNAKAVTPLNGQMLTLPPPVVKKLTLNRPLALKINNRQITVPPSGFFHSDDGLKVFLPPNTFPTAEDCHEGGAVSDGKSSASESSPGKVKDGNNVKTPDKKDGDVTVTNSTPEKCVEKLDIRKNKYYSRCCLIQKIYGVYDCMVNIFKYLSLHDLLRMGCVCKTWRNVVQMPCLWNSVNFNNIMVKDWEKAVKYISRRNVQSISLVGVLHFEDPNRTWHQLASSINELSTLRRITFCRIPPTVLQTIVSKLSRLESLTAEMITAYTDESMCDKPSKLDIGNISTLTELEVLKLHGDGGLTLPSFNFGCGLLDFGKLINLKVLHMTSLKNVKGSDFMFLSSLVNVEDLAIGDCELWTDESYSCLKEMKCLKVLRLECSDDTMVTGLGNPLIELTQLESLKLWKYALSSSFADEIIKVKQLKHLCVYPASQHSVADVNTNTLNAVKKLTHLKTLDWVFQENNSSTIILSETGSSHSDQWIPFQTEVPDNSEETRIEYISVTQLKQEKLEKSLPDTKVNVYSATTLNDSL